MFTARAQTHRAAQKAGLRQMILDASRDLFEQDGYENFSLRKLATKIEYSPASFYLHFKNKEELFLSLVDESFGRFLEAQRALDPPERIEDPVEILKKALRSYVDFGLNNPNDYRLAFLLRRPDGVPLQNSQPAYDRLRQKVAACSDTDIDLTTQSLWCAVHGVTSLLIQRPAFPWVSREKLIHKVIDSGVGALIAKERASAKR